MGGRERGLTPAWCYSRLAQSYDVMVLLPRSKQGFVNSGLLVARRERASEWAAEWLREFLSLDDFGDQLHLLKAPPRSGWAGGAWGFVICDQADDG